jgi:hypothetical protein
MFKSNFQDIFITHLSFRAKRNAVEKSLSLGYKFCSNTNFTLFTKRFLRSLSLGRNDTVSLLKAQALTY